MATKPTLSFEMFKQTISPDTHHTPQTYVAYQIVPEQVPREARQKGVGAEFIVSGATRRELPSIPRGTRLRITQLDGEWVWAVPAEYAERFWE